MRFGAARRTRVLRVFFTIHDPTARNRHGTTSGRSIDRSSSRSPTHSARMRRR